MKGIVLAGGSGTRLHPLTLAISKQMMPVYDKPMIYYPLTTLMYSGINEILIISTPHDLPLFKKLLGDGSKLGINLSYLEQDKPSGIAEAFIIGENFIGDDNVCLVLGDNIFYGQNFSATLCDASKISKGAKIFSYPVTDPERFGIVETDANGLVKSLEEKPKSPKTNNAVTGLYFVDGSAPERAKQVKPSARGELEITSLLEAYLNDGKLRVEKMGRGYAWLDTGTHNSLLDAANFVRTLTERQGLQVGSPDEIAYKLKWITKDQLKARSKLFGKNRYGQYLENL